MRIQLVQRRSYPTLLAPAQWRHVRAAHRLTAREAEVVEEAARGFSNDEISRRLGIQPDTLRKHLRAVYKKTSCTGRVDLLLLLVHEYLRASPQGGIDHRIDTA